MSDKRKEEVALLVKKYGLSGVLKELRDEHKLDVQFDCEGSPLTYTPLSRDSRITLERYVAIWRSLDAASRKIVTDPLVRKITKLGFESGQKNEPPSEEYEAYHSARGILFHAGSTEEIDE